LTPTVAFFLGITLNWRLSFVFFGTLSVITAYMLGQIEVQEELLKNINTSYWEFLKIPGLWLILLYNVFVGYLFRSVDLFFPSFLSVDRAYSGELAAIASSLIIFFGTFGQILGGRGSDRYGSTKVLIITTLGMVISEFNFSKKNDGISLWTYVFFCFWCWFSFNFNNRIFCR
jgi:nitrate/nitrite transporter NarK